MSLFFGEKIIVPHSRPVFRFGENVFTSGRNINSLTKLRELGVTTIVSAWPETEVLKSDAARVGLKVIFPKEYMDAKTLESGYNPFAKAVAAKAFELSRKEKIAVCCELGHFSRHYFVPAYRALVVKKALTKITTFPKKKLPFLRRRK